jgi:NDP-4-keto-2,6-dideoxyhexose 3-C-methyltransferase
MNVTKERYCRICGEELKDVIDFGDVFISSFEEKSGIGEKAPLVLAECVRCKLVQLRHTVDLDTMYRQYWYRSGLNASMKRDLKDVVSSIEERVNFSSGDTVIDIGCNDSTLFDFYTRNDIKKIGFDPALNLKEITEQRCDLFINTYFNSELLPKYTEAKVITAIAMFYDLPDPDSFVNDITTVLADDGIFVIQFTDLLSMLKYKMVDSICHEHLEYYKLSDIERLMMRYGLEIFDVEYNQVNGGSVRVYICWQDSYKISNRVKSYLDLEYTFLNQKENSFKSFESNINNYKKLVLEYLSKYETKDIYALAASTKGNYLLQLFDLSDKITAIGEINSDKIGLVTGGTGVPIFWESDVLSKNPKVIIILAWGFHKTFINLLEDYAKNGGIVLFPLPEPTIYREFGEIKL